MYELAQDSKASTHPAPADIASAPSTRIAKTTPWTFCRQVIPNLPLCFSNYARSETKYRWIPVHLRTQA